MSWSAGCHTGGLSLVVTHFWVGNVPFRDENRSQSQNWGTFFFQKTSVRLLCAMKSLLHVKELNAGTDRSSDHGLSGLSGVLIGGCR